jgi:hypothetical protein
MVWAGICHVGRTQLKIVQGTLNVVKYKDDNLGPIVLPFLQQRTFDHVFQHDNARFHVARVWLIHMGITNKAISTQIMDRQKLSCSIGGLQSSVTLAATTASHLRRIEKSIIG